MSKKESRFEPQGDSLSTESNTFLAWYGDELEAQSERIAEEKEIDDEETLDKLLGKLSYLKKEYIVEGALLTCSKCIKENTKLKYKGEIVDCEFSQEEKRKRIHILDDRSEKINGLIPVNIRDCKGGLRDDKEKDERVNIVSMGNCGFLYEKEDIEEIIRESGSSNTPEEIIEALEKGMGTCYCFMDLNAEWENMPLEIADSIGGNTRLPCAGVEEAFRTPKYFKFNGEEGINMMSMLFCQFGGGCITAMESGQTSYFNDMRYQKLLEEVDRKKGRIEEYKIDFVLEVFPKILEDEKVSGIPAEITFAQICIESAYGNDSCVDIYTGVNGNNYFGIKGVGTTGSVSCNTHEEINGKRIAIVADFRAYNSMEESIKDHSDLLVNNYQKYVTTGTIEDWCNALIKGKYATASNYKQTILQVCHTWNIM
ncbi:glucosaminidase domain-containing protein [Lachnospiraceae bacterium 64-25]|nr:exo-glucosaminidase LytG [Lachnospiraceae bacterium]